MTGRDWLQAILSAQPISWSALQPFVGELGVEIDARDWFLFYRDGLDAPLRAISVSFDPFREAGDAPLAFYRIATRIAMEQAREVVADRGLAPGFAFEPLNGRLMLDWNCPIATALEMPLDIAVRERFLSGFLEGLAGARSARALRDVCTPPPGAGIALSAQPAKVRAADGLSLIPARAPIVHLKLQPPMEALRAAALLGVERPLAISTDVHQAAWWMASRGRELAPDPGGTRVGATELQIGPWDVRVQLEDRPPGPLPSLSVGPSPAYDLTKVPARVGCLHITPLRQL